MNLWIIFLTGLTSGGISCLAMQGGLLTGIIANQKQREITQNPNQPALNAQTFDQMDWLPVVMFLITKLISHTLFGFFLGALGSVLKLSLGMQLSFQFLAALFMLATAGNLLQLHPIFRYAAFTPPKFMQRWVRKTSRSSALFAPAVLGVMTLFIPCGVTQAMEVLAITSGNPWIGALIMFFFVLGTSPLFALLGIATAKFSEAWRDRFLKAAAVALVIMAVWSLNGVLLVVGSPITLQGIGNAIASFGAPPSTGTDLAKVQNGVQAIELEIGSGGYTPRYVQVKAGVPVKLTLTSNGSYSCANAFTFREFGIFTQLKPTDSKTFTFTPEKPGRYTYTCSMGMYSGVMEVI